MDVKNILIYCTHGTYGRDDDAYGAMLAANAALAKGMDVTIVLADDGVAMGKSGQDPSGLGLPNNLDEMADFLELGGRLLVMGGSMEERGIAPGELVEGAEVITAADMVAVIEGHDVSMTY